MKEAIGLQPRKIHSKLIEKPEQTVNYKFIEKLLFDITDFDNVYSFMISQITGSLLQKYWVAAEGQ